MLRIEGNMPPPRALASWCSSGAVDLSFLKGQGLGAQCEGVGAFGEGMVSDGE